MAAAKKKAKAKKGKAKKGKAKRKKAQRRSSGKLTGKTTLAKLAEHFRGMEKRVENLEVESAQSYKMHLATLNEIRRRNGHGAVKSIPGARLPRLLGSAGRAINTRKALGSGKKG